jgi:hypothetical protein
MVKVEYPIVSVATVLASPSKQGLKMQLYLQELFSSMLSGSFSFLLLPGSFINSLLLCYVALLP